MFAVSAFPRLSGLFLAIALAVAAYVPSPAFAQQEPEFFDQPYAPGQWNIGRRLDQSELRYCVDPRDPAWQVDGDIAEAIASGLLLQPKRYVVPSQIVLEDLTKVYAILLENCDVYMGFKLIPEGYPNWVTITRAYYDIGYVYVAADPAITSLSQIKAGRPVAATLGTSAHFQLISYELGLPPAKRWPIFPYGNNDLALRAVHDGTADVALVWAPSFWGMKQSDPEYAAFHVIDASPLQPTTLGVGALVLKKNTFLRNAVDEAIAALTSDGTIQAILDKHEFPATAKP